MDGQPENDQGAGIDPAAEAGRNPMLRPLPEAPEAVSGRRMRARISQITLIKIRWVAVAGQAATILFVHYWLGYELPLWPALAIVGISVALNVAAVVQGKWRLRLVERDAALYLGYDMCQLVALLFLTGGLLNPFVVLMLAPLTVSATLLSYRSTTTLTGLALAGVVLLAFWHYPLPGGMPSSGSPYHLGVGLAMGIAILFVSNYVWQVAADARQVSDALGATQLALEREQRISLLGGLAAAAAHQLGTPLGTITLIAREMRRDVPADSPMAEDIALLEQEVNRCRDILTELARRPEPDDEDPFRLMSLPALAGAAAETYLHSENRRLAITAAEGPPGQTLMLRRTPELIHGLGNLIQNALQFARNRVEISAEYGPKTVALKIVDDGPGFPLALLGRLGEPYVSGRGEDSDHMGLGIFIAATLLEHSGAQLSFSNGPQGGAVIAVAWPRHKFERKERTWA